MRAAMTRGAVAGALLLLVGCGAQDGQTAPEAADGANQPGQTTHTMPDGTVMDGAEHEDHQDHGDSAAAPSVGPSPAAEMVCSGQVVEDVARIMALEEQVTPSSAWQEPMFTCTFDLAAGPLVLSVHDAEREATGMAHFEELRAEQEGASAIKGVYSLGLPAFETERGTVAFVKDGKTLEVDATQLEGDELGVDGSMDRTEVAYAVATSVLACWTQHA